jgi:hypothetical protein
VDITLSGHSGDTVSLYENVNPAPVLLASGTHVTASLAPGVVFLAVVSGGTKGEQFTLTITAATPAT